MIAERNPVRILVVEDNADNAWALTRLLEIHGFEVNTCLYARDALANIEQWRPDVVMLDLGMPGINGF
jgi:CheY-like chemotaxis protein